jgi:cystathionine beta-lyase family protein involved in aluminum resistance
MKTLPKKKIEKMLHSGKKKTQNVFFELVNCYHDFFERV